MFFNEPAPTPYDLHFRCLGFPVRVAPMFWVLALVSRLGSKGEVSPRNALLWVAVVFVSILVHELGHALLQRRWGGRSRIVLHGFGGLAISDHGYLGTWRQIAISLAGPGAGFLLALGTLLVLWRTSGWLEFIPAWSAAEVAGPAGANTIIRTDLLFGTLWYLPAGSELADGLFHNLLWVNVGWGLLNLMPIYPLDGGHVARELLSLMRNTRQGIEWSLYLSMAAAGLVALYALSRNSMMSTALFGYLAYNNYQTLTAYQYGGWR